MGELQWERLALTEEQVEQYDLPKITKNDRRFQNGGGVHGAVETEALSPRGIIDIVRARLDELLPESLEDVGERAAPEREDVRRKLTN